MDTARSNPKKILLVDDSQTVLLMERMLLARHRYEIVTAKNGAEGIAQALAHRPDLIVMDVVMPVMDGFEAVRRIRADDRLKQVPVIMVTTRGEAENVEAGFAAGCSDYVTKPIDAMEFLTKVKSHLGDEVRP